MGKDDNSSWKFIKQYRKEILIGILLLLVVIFLVQNSHEVKFSLVFWKMQIPLIILLLIWLFMGMVTAAIYYFVGNRDLKRKIKALKKELETKETKSTSEIIPEALKSNDSSSGVVSDEDESE